MKLLTISIFLILLAGSTYFQFDQPLKSDISGIEKQFGSERYKLKSMVFLADDFFPNAATYDLEQPLVYIRTDNEFHVQPEVSYYFTPDDSVRLITHSWDTKGVSKNIEYNQDFSKSKEKDIKQWNSKFKQLQAEITSELGTPTQGKGELESKSKSGYGVWKERNLMWKSNGSTTELKMIWTEQDVQLSEGVRLVPTFRIRTKTYW